MAFSINHLNGADPTDSTLDDFERKELANYKKTNKPNTSVRLQQNIDDIGSDEDDDVMGAYICTTPKVKGDNLSDILKENEKFSEITGKKAESITWNQHTCQQYQE